MFIFINIQKEIDFLKNLLNDHLEHYSAEEQNTLIDLIQKMVLIRDKQNIFIKSL